MSHPTDRELEAKIIQMINKYENIPTEIGKKLYDFFNNIYKRFFDDDEYDDDGDNEVNKNIEAMTNQDQTSKDTSTNPTKNPTTNPPGYQGQNIVSVQQFDYSPDKLQLNPLLNQTIQRVISIDSQYRNINIDQSTTSFSFDLSEPLRDVVSLKLYSVQIPYTWYTVGKNYGSNFFYIRGVSNGISDKKYQIAINPGNYDQTTLPQAINKSFYDISNSSASDINFNGLDLIAYDTNTAKTTVQLNIQNTFTDSYYTMNFGFWTSPTDASKNIYSIPGYTGFNYQTYNLNSINSNPTYYSTNIINSQYSQNFTLDNSNNFFTVIQYLGYNEYTKYGYDPNNTILNQYTIQLLNSVGQPYNGPATRQNIIDAVNTAINNSNLFDTGSQIQRIDITNPTTPNNGNSYFQLSLTLNRFNTKYVPNSKLRVVFPSESIKFNQYGEPFTIWQYQSGVNYSCFYFDNSENNFSQFISESPAINSTITIDNYVNIIMRCTIPTYNNGLNDFSMNIPSKTYNTLTQYLSAITDSFKTKNTYTNQYFNMTNTKALLDSNNTFHLQIDLTKSFTNKNYKLVIDGNSFLKNPATIAYLDISYSIISHGNIIPNPPPTNLNDISYINISVNQNLPQYSIDTSCVFIIQPDTTYGNGGNGGSDQITVVLDSTNYSTYNGFVTAIQRALLTTQITNTDNTQTPLNRSVLSLEPSTNNIKIELDCYYYLIESNYDISFVDGILDMSNVQNAWNPLKINSFYDLSQQKSQNGYALITGYDTVGSASKSINIIDNCNNTITFTTNNPNAPSDTITIKIPQNSYTIGTLYSIINEEFSKNPKTYGSFISYNSTNTEEYSVLWININRVYTTQDYVLDFYDPVNFTSCNSGSKSIQNTTWDTTIGWMLGFRDYTQYFLTSQNQTASSTPLSNPYYLSSSNGSYIIKQNIDPNSNLVVSNTIFLTGDTTLSTNLYNYFLISLDDFIQNHLNDGLVTITRSQTTIQIPDYVYSTKQSCDPATGELVSTSITQLNSDNVTNSQLYALNQSITSQQNPSKQYSPGPFIKDLFGIIPYKAPGQTGDYYTEYGGSLQNQERLYFGPVNIRKMSIQLLTDRGTLLDLNGSNWSFSFICQQLYRSTST